MSALYTLANMKKDPSKSDESLLVTHRVRNWNQIKAELMRWDELFRDSVFATSADAAR